MRSSFVVQVSLTLIMFMLLAAVPAGAAQLTVENPSFEAGTAADGYPVGWPAVFGVPGFGKEVTLSTQRAYDGQHSIRIEDTSSAISAGLRSAVMPAQAGLHYTAAAMNYNERGRAQLYLEFWNDKNVRIATEYARNVVVGNWARIEVRAQAPAGTTGVTVLFFTTKTDAAVVTYFDAVTLHEGATASAAPIKPVTIAPLQFDLSQAPLGVTNVAAVRAKVPQGRPRLFARPDTIDALRKRRDNSPMAQLIWKNISNKALSSAFSVMPPEPPHAYPGGTFDSMEWRKGRDIASDIVNRLDSLAFAYLLDGNTFYGDAGKKLLLHVSKWDPYGTSGRKINDEVSMRLLYSMSRAYDWLWEYMTPEERQIVQASLRERGNDVYMHMRNTRFEENLLDNHLVRTTGFLGQAAIALMGEIPEAADWFDYIVSIFLTKYPAFGGDEGGWSQGVGYWQDYMSWVLEYIEALRIATGLDLYQKPFFQNTAFFKLYSHPPKSQFGAFGDGSDLKPNTTSAQVVGRFALALKEPALQWYADQLAGMGRVASLPMDSFLGYILYPEDPADLVDPVLPADLPQSRTFTDIGWTLMNTDMSDWKNNVHIKFKSSPYGSFNHSHAEQNSFLIEAYGSPLAISTGYYPYYNSPHHANWTRASISKNTILVNGYGQGINSLDANGKIIANSFGSQFDYTAGDATPAYLGRLESFVRQLWFIKPNIIAIFDEIEAPGKATYDWLLHTEQEMEVDAAAQRLRVPAATAEMWAYFAASGDLKLSQTDQFNISPEEPYTDRPNQWHFTARLESPDGSGRFLTLLIPRPIAQAQKPVPVVKSLTATNGYATEVQADGVRYTIAFRSGTALLDVAGYQTDAQGLTVWTQADANGFMGLGTTNITQDDKILFQAEKAMNIGVAWSRTAEGSVLHLQLDDAASCDFKVTADTAPVQVIVSDVALAANAWTFANGELHLES